jgi:bifunctional UDP-N-acetylglucosamine pyrophosphorylase / glucosamine-1-phosphate N-acetyltransferase
MTGRTGLAIVLAAGEGTRMRSSRAKVLHPVAQRPMVAHVVAAAAAAGLGEAAIVVGRDAAGVEDAVREAGIAIAATFVTQTERLGTAHAVLAARDAIANGHDDIVIMFGDTPLVRASTLEKARTTLAQGADIAVIGFRTDRPDGYGRLVMSGDELVAIREHKDASEEERAITFCNGGLMAIAGNRALAWLEKIGNENAKNEYYLTDIVEIARREGARAVAVEAAYDELIGVNTRAELAEVEALWQERRRLELMLSGVSMTAPHTVFLAHDTAIAADVTIEPDVVFGPGVRVEAGAAIRAFSHIEGARIAAGCEVGPFARLRPGADLHKKAKVGNFCEVKKAVVGEGAKINHLSYVGDAVLGAGVNIGAGTITCNYDGHNKFETRIGAGSFIGSNTSLVAPVSVGAGAYIASGSVITEDVDADALAFGRARQVSKAGRGREIKDRNAALKAKRATARQE